MSSETCPHCRADLRGESTPDRPGEWCSRKIGVEILGVYDGCLFWRCPDCARNWHRFPEGNYLRTLAAPYVGNSP